MPNKTLLYAIVGIILVFFILLMLSGTILKKPFSQDDDFNYHLNQIRLAITNDKWEKADNSLKDIEIAWGKVRPRVFFSADQDDIRLIDERIAMLKANVEVREKGLALETVAILQVSWDSIH